MVQQTLHKIKTNHIFLQLSRPSSGLHILIFRYIMLFLYYYIFTDQKQPLHFLYSLYLIVKSMGHLEAFTNLKMDLAPGNLAQIHFSREQGVGSREQGIGSREQGVGSRDQGVGSREQRVENREQRVESREQGVGSREQGVGSREQGVGSRKQGVGSRE